VLARSPQQAGFTPTNVLGLQRAAGNRATRRYLQRMIVAIDGDKDAEPSKNATRACLYNLRYKKGGADFVDGGARGAVAGPDTARNLPSTMRPLLAKDDESIYVLAHGSRYSASIADMTPKQMAAWLRSHFSSDYVWGLGWLGVTKTAAKPFTGKIKLVSCHSAADSRHRLATDASTIYPFSSSYAEELARALKPTSKDDPFQPSSVQGINGIGWVDEVSGAITAIDKAKYDAATATMASNSDVGSVASGKTINPFTSMSDPVKRGAALHAVFGKPVEAKVDKAAGLRTGKAEWGKRTFAVGTGVEL
jgi:hypothetical protein